MLRSRDVNKEVKRLDDHAKANEKSDVGMIVKGISLIIKLLRDMRTNQVTDLKSRNVELIEEKRPTDEKPESK